MITDLQLQKPKPYQDIKLNFNNACLNFDQSLSLSGDLSQAIILSLFSDARASEDELPPGEISKQGWWADVLDDSKKPLGSKLWLLKREVLSDEVLERAIEYVQSALSWMVDVGLVKKVNVDTERDGNELIIQILLLCADDTKNYKFRMDSERLVFSAI